MTAVTPALTSDEIAALNGPSTLQTYLVTFPDTTIATAEINGSLAYPIAQIPTTSESAGWTDIKEGMTVIIETAAGLEDVARFRCRADVTGTGAISVAQFGANDTGAVSFINPIAIQDGHLIRVVNTRDIVAKYPRIVYNGGTSGNVYEDYDKQDTLANLQPSPVVRIAVNNNRGGHYAVKVPDGETVDIEAAVEVEHWPSSSTVLAYLWTCPVEFTDVAGTTSNTLTATVPIGKWEINCLVTPNYGAPFLAVRYIIVCDDTTNPPIRIASVGGDSRNRTARRITLDLNDTAIASIKNGQGVIVFEQGTWNEDSVPTASTTFVGWLVRHSGSASGGLRQAAPELIGVGEVLNGILNSSQLFEVTNIPASWQQMGYQLATYNWCIWWLLTYRVSNVLHLFNFYPYSSSATIGRQPAFDVGGGTILSQVQSLATRYRKGNVGSASDGAIFVTTQPHMMLSSERSSFETRAVLTASRYMSAIYQQDVRPRVRQVMGSAFTWDGVSARPTPLRADAPEVPGQGSADETLDGQIVDSQFTMDWLAALYYEWINNPFQSVTVVVPGNWDVLEPAEMSLVDLTIPASISPTGTTLQFDNAVVVSVNKRRLGNGASEIELTVEPLTLAASKGVTRAVPAPGENVDPSIPPIDEVFPSDPIFDWGPELPIDPANPTPLDPQPGATDEYPDIYLGTSDNHAARVTNNVFVDISPTSDQRTALGTGIQFVQDPWDYKRAFLIGSSGIAYTNDITAASVVWNTYARYGLPETWIETLELDSTDGNIVPNNDDDPSGAQWIMSTGWTVGVGSGAQAARLYLQLVAPKAFELTHWSAEFTSALALQTFRSATLSINFTTLQSDDSVVASPGGTITWNGNQDIATGDHLNLNAYNEDGSGVGRSAGDLASIRWTLGGNGNNPFDDAPAFAGDDETLIGSFQGYLNKKNAYCWLSKRTISAVDYVYFNRTFDNFASRQQVQVATWVAAMNYSIAISPHNWRFVWVSAGEPGVDGYVYRSFNGGGSFESTGVGLYLHGGQLSWNWSTSTPNDPNILQANILMIRGLNSSNNYLIRRGVAGSDVVIATGAGKYGIQPGSLCQLPRDGDFVIIGLQDNSVRKSSNFATSFSGATNVSGTQLRGLWRWPTDSVFGLLYGDDLLSYTIDTFSSYTDMYSAYDTFRSGAYGSEGTTIIAAFIDLGQHYIRPVASEA